MNSRNANLLPDAVLLTIAAVVLAILIATT